MRKIIEQALHLWAIEGSDYTLAAARENAVYRIQTDTRMVALRLHRQGYRTNHELQSELQWMAALSKSGIRVPDPVKSANGNYLHLVENIQVDVLDWLNGSTVSALLDELNLSERTNLFRNIGVEMAKLHEACDRWETPQDFSRWSWDRPGLLGAAPVWDRFWENPRLSNSERHLLETFREKADAHLAEIGNELDYGLIHADLVPDNMMVDGGNIQLLDFDDGGYGYRIFEIATALLKHRNTVAFEALSGALIDGYTSIRFINLEHLELFMALRATTYVGWNISRMKEDTNFKRNERFIKTAAELSQNYLMTT